MMDAEECKTGERLVVRADGYRYSVQSPAESGEGDYAVSARANPENRNSADPQGGTGKTGWDARLEVPHSPSEDR